MELAIPRRTRPLSEHLQQAGGALSDRTLAQRLIRRFETEGAAQPGARLRATCAPSVASAAEPLVRALSDRMGARFSITADPTWGRDRLEVSAT